MGEGFLKYQRAQVRSQFGKILLLTGLFKSKERKSSENNVSKPIFAPSNIIILLFYWYDSLYGEANCLKSVVAVGLAYTK